MMLQDILQKKGRTIHTIGPEATLEDVVQTLVKHNVGSLVVCDSQNGCPTPMLGIITERDMLRAMAKYRGQLAAYRVTDAMTSDVVTATPTMSVEEAMGLLTERRIRHLPVMEDDKLVGLVSIGDIVKQQHDELSLENHYLKSYIHG